VGERIADAATLAALDRYAADFGGKRREVCEATRVRGEQSDAVLALRMACLDRVAGRFAGLTEELDHTAGVDATAIATRLPELAACDDVETLAKLTNRMAARSSRDSTEQDRAWTLAVRLLERASTRRLLGRDDAREPAMQARALADDHDLPGVHARALSILADLELEAGDGASAQRLRREAMRHGVADGHDDAVVSMLLDDADAALQDARAGETELLLGYFEAFVDRMTDADARVEIERRAEIVRARLALARGDAAEAERRLDALAVESLPVLDRRAAWMALGEAQRARGEAEAATATWSRLLALVEDLRGDRHPDVAAVLNNLALVRLDDGDADGADALLARAESIVTEASGTAALQATIATNRGWAARLGHRYDEARRRLEHARALREVAFGPRHPSMAYTLDQLGELERALGRWDAALEAFAAAGELRDATLGAMHPALVSTLIGTARVLIARGENDRARAALGVAREILDAHSGGVREREMIAALEAAMR
jgi:tetratricopeptide (TPR) repeat protein